MLVGETYHRPFLQTADEMLNPEPLFCEYNQALYILGSKGKGIILATYTPGKGQMAPWVSPRLASALCRGWLAEVAPRC